MSTNEVILLITMICNIIGVVFVTLDFLLKLFSHKKKKRK